MSINELNELPENFTPKDQKKNTAQTILPREVVKQFANRRSDYHGLKQLIFHLSLIFFSQYLVYYTSNRLILNILSRIFCGYTISFLFMGEHECVHHTAFKTPILNDIVQYMFGLGCFRPPLHYRYYHWGHHRFTGNKSKDPELQNTFIDFDIAGSFLKYFAYLSGIPFWIDRITCLIRHSLLFIIDNIFYIKLNKNIEYILLPKDIEYYLVRQPRRYRVTFEALIFLIIYLFIFIIFPINILWLYWIQPSLIGQIFLRGYLIAEHRECKSNPNMWDNSRTTKTFWLHYTLAWNMPWHLEHHAFPYVPFYLLPELHQIIVKNVKGEDQFYKKSGCKPDGSQGYFSVHRQILKDIANRKK